MKKTIQVSRVLFDKINKKDKFEKKKKPPNVLIIPGQLFQIH